MLLSPHGEAAPIGTTSRGSWTRPQHLCLLPFFLENNRAFMEPRPRAGTPDLTLGALSRNRLLSHPGAQRSQTCKPTANSGTEAGHTDKDTRQVLSRRVCQDSPGSQSHPPKGVGGQITPLLKPLLSFFFLHKVQIPFVAPPDLAWPKLPLFPLLATWDFVLFLKHSTSRNIHGSLHLLSFLPETLLSLFPTDCISSK